MKYGILFVLALSGLAASADNQLCFHAGTYVGKGIGVENGGQPTQYDVTSVINDAMSGTNSYDFAGQKESFQFQAQADGKLLLDGKDTGSTIQCNMSSEIIHMAIEDFTLDEEWTLNGNYLLRKGVKKKGSVTVGYQELLYRTK